MMVPAARCFLVRIIGIPSVGWREAQTTADRVGCYSELERKGASPLG